MVFYSCPLDLKKFQRLVFGKKIPSKLWVIEKLRFFFSGWDMFDPSRFSQSLHDKRVVLGNPCGILVNGKTLVA